jgi:hypothetical protein
VRSRREVEREAGEVVPRLRSRAGATGDLTSGTVPPAMRRPVEDWAGVDLSHIGLDSTTDPRAVAGDPVAAFDRGTSTIYAGLARPLAGTALARDILLRGLALHGTPEAAAALARLRAER